MKNVLFISYDGMTDPLGQSQVIPYLVGLAKRGYKITLLSCEKKQRYHQQSETIRAILGEAGIDWQVNFFTRRPPFLSKVYDVWKLKNTAIALYKKKQFNFVHCRSYVSASAGLLLHQKFGVPFLFDMRGFWVDERVDNGQWDLKNPFFRFFYKRYKRRERAYFRESHHIISLTWKGREELIRTYGIEASKITVIPCCVDMVHFDYHKINQDDLAEKKKRLGIVGKETVISYLGSLGGWYLVREMIDFFAEMKKSVPSAKFLFITQDPPKMIFDAAQASGVEASDVIIQPALRKDVPAYLALSDHSIFFIKDAYSKRASSPTKQGEIMAMGIPLICNDIGDTGKIVDASRSGCLVREFDAKEYRRVVDLLPSLDQIGKEQIRSAASEYFDLEKGVARYAEVYKLMADVQQ